MTVIDYNPNPDLRDEAPQAEGEDDVEDPDRQIDDCPSAASADAFGTAAGEAAVGAVHQGHDGGEHNRLGSPNRAGPSGEARWKK